MAWLALRINYRNNFGLKPILLVKSHGVTAGNGWVEVHCAFEVWNRRKYSLVVREMQVSFGETKIDYKAPNVDGEETAWSATNAGNLLWSEKHAIEASQYGDFEAVGPIIVSRSAGMRLEVWVDLFDPRENGHVILHYRERNLPRWAVIWRRRRLPRYSTWERVKRRSAMSRRR